MSHTPGPWRIEVSDGAKHLRSAKGDSLMCNMDFYPWTPDNPDDWTLIAAAPRLADELNRALAVIRSPQSFEVEQVCTDIESALRLAGVK